MLSFYVGHIDEMKKKDTYFLQHGTIFYKQACTPEDLYTVVLSSEYILVIRQVDCQFCTAFYMKCGYERIKNLLFKQISVTVWNQIPFFDT